MSLDFNELIKPVSRKSILSLEDRYVWGATVVKGDDSKYHMIFSTWLKSKHHNAWVTDSELGYAVSDNPTGPYEFKEIILKGSGGDNWDANSIHNPTMIRVKDKYYLYYMGNKGNGEYWNNRNNQRVGVAVADHPSGPWKRFDKPIIDVTKGSWDSLVCTNPTVTQGPDGKIIMVYKGVGDGPLPKGGAVVCGVAVADDPLGPFEKVAGPIMVNPENDWSVEDPYIWYGKDRFYALVKDFQGYFTKIGESSVALFESQDAIKWYPSEHAFAFKREILWEDGELQKVHCLERPQLYIEDGVPKVLFCAMDFDNDREYSYNVHIPLN